MKVILQEFINSCTYGQVATFNYTKIFVNTDYFKERLSKMTINWEKLHLLVHLKLEDDRFNLLKQNLRI